MSLHLLKMWVRSSSSHLKEEQAKGYSRKRTQDERPLLEGNTYYRFQNEAQVIPVQIMTNVYYRVWPGCLLAYTCTCVCISSAAPWKNFSQSFFLRTSAQRQLPRGLGYSHGYTRTSTLYAFEHEPLFDSRYRETILWMNVFFFFKLSTIIGEFFHNTRSTL